MDLQQIKAFIDAMAGTDFAEMEFSQDGWTLRLARGTGGAQSALPSVVSEPVRPSIATAAPPHEDAGRFVEDVVRAPLYGVAHLRPSPGEPLFVTPGLAVKTGQTLCVIEAMKVFNEVRAECDGVVDAVLITSGQEVEAGQPLVRLALTP
jgi:acetyl-CoA carboxylase biotin carboxyl carrier protein